MITIDILPEIWEAMRPHLAGGDKQAAEDFVNVLADNGVELAEFNEMISDRHIKEALLEYIDHDDLEEEGDDYFDEIYADLEY